MFEWLENAVQTEFEVLRTLKQSPRGSVLLLCHKATRQRFILRRFTGSGEVYQKLLGLSCANLPTILEAAAQ